MSKLDIIESVMSLESLDELAAYLESARQEDIRAQLLSRFDALIDYEDANEWAFAVRICEALAIVGWGTREQVDAISRFDGDCWETKFVTDRNEYRFRLGRWSKRKAGWVLRNPEYHASPDFADRPSIDWKHYAGNDFPIVDRENLPSQRNSRKQMPITMGQIGGSNRTSKAAAALRRELARELRETMTPTAYGDAIEKFYFTLNCPALSRTFEPHLKVGAYNAKNKAFYCDLFFGAKFGQLPPREQRDYFADNLLVAIDALASKLRKRKIEYDISAFRADVVTAIENWHRNSGS
jgi:hypothetical protein